MTDETPVTVTRNYYDSDSADNFYSHVWGGEDIHIGLYGDGVDSIAEASRKTVDAIADHIKHLPQGSRVLDIGAGYGGSARAIARKYGWHVTCLNLSEVQNRRNRQMTAEQGLADQIDVVDGDFENLPFDADSFDGVWSQDSILHSGNRKRVFEEVDRVLRKGGDFVFTDPMQREGVSAEELKPVLERIHLSSMGSVSAYRSFASELGWSEVAIELMTPQLVNHYSSVLRELDGRGESLVKEGICSQDYVDRMRAGLKHWIEAGGQHRLEWGILHFRK